jgi:hypothetical protein
MTDFQMPVPGPPHKRLALLAGEWAGEEVLHPSPWDPEGGTALGRYTFGVDGARLGVRIENSADARTWRTFLEGSYERRP